MANSPLPLLMLAAGAFYFLKGKGGPAAGAPNIFIVDKEKSIGEYEALAQEFRDDGLYDVGVAIMSTVEGSSAAGLAAATVDVARENPRTLFTVIGPKDLDWVLDAIYGQSVPMVGNAIIISVTDHRTGLTATRVFEDVKLEHVAAKIPTGYNFALKDLGNMQNDHTVMASSAGPALIRLLSDGVLRGRA